MKKVLSLVILALFICCTAFAYHAPDRDEFFRVQSTLSGDYYDTEGKLGTISLSFNDDNSVDFRFKDVKHKLTNAKIEVDYNKKYSVRVTGNCSDKDCLTKSIMFSVSCGNQERINKITNFLVVAIIINKDKTFSNDSCFARRML